MAHAGIIDIDKLNTALDETEKRKQHEADMEKQLDEVVQKRDIIRMLGDLPLYHVGFGRLVKGANLEINEPLIKLSDLMNAVAKLPTAQGSEVIRCKDCEYRTGEGSCWWHADNSSSCSTELYSIYSWYVDDNDYCSMAERKEE